MPDPKKFCSQDDVKRMTNLHPEFKGRDASIDGYIYAATEAIEGFCNRVFTPQTGVREFFGTPLRTYEDLAAPVHDAYTVFLREPNVDPTSVQVYLDYRFQWTTDSLLTPMPALPLAANTTASYDYMLADSVVGNKLVLMCALRHHEKSLFVIYNSGYPYDATDSKLLVVPDKVRRATALQTAFVMNRSATDTLGTDSSQTGSPAGRSPGRKEAAPGSGIIPEVAYLLRDFRRNLTRSM